jgi:branched-chain amino acid transport system permease protein
LIAVREDEVLASFLGIDVMRHKLAAYVISSTLAAMVGTLYAPVMSFISPDLLSVQETISLIGVVILGGAGTLAGPIVGTFVFLGIPEFLRIESLYRLIVLGVVIVLVVLLMPQGIVGVANRVLKRWQRTTPAPAPAKAEA